MAYALGIDVGTSYTAAAICRAGASGVEPGLAVALGTRSTAVPSVVYVDDETWVFGEAAERRIHDRPQLVVRDFKRRVGDPVPLLVGETLIPAEMLGARIVRWVVDQVAAQEGAAADMVAITHPASWGDYKRALLRAALEDVGLGSATFVSEPVAAAAHYAAQGRVPLTATVAVYDLGGGTFDAAVVRKEDDGSFRVLGEPGGLDHVGGVDFDHAIFGYVREAAQLGPVAADDADALAALARLRRECTEAKEALSSDTEATIPVLLPGTRTRVRLVRIDVEALMMPALVETADAFVDTVSGSGVELADLDAVLLVGGSSRIPLVAELLSARLGRPVGVDADPKTSIALGAALLAAAHPEAVMIHSAAEVLSGAPPVPVPAPAPVPALAAATETSVTTRPRSRRRAAVVAAAIATSTIVTASAMALSSVVGEPETPAAGAQREGDADRTDGSTSSTVVAATFPDIALDPFYRALTAGDDAVGSPTTLVASPLAAPPGLAAVAPADPVQPWRSLRPQPSDRLAPEDPEAPRTASARDAGGRKDLSADGATSTGTTVSTSPARMPRQPSTPTTSGGAAPPSTTAAPAPPGETEPPAVPDPVTTTPTATDPPPPASTDPPPPASTDPPPPASTDPPPPVETEPPPPVNTEPPPPDDAPPAEEPPADTSTIAPPPGDGGVGDPSHPSTPL